MNQKQTSNATTQEPPALQERLSAFNDVAWTVGGVATLAVLGIAVRAAGAAGGLTNDACWQLTGARAAAATAVLGTLVSLRRGQFALFGVLYGAWLVSTHWNVLLVGSAALAGIGARLAIALLADRGAIVRMLGVSLAFNVLLTASGLIKAIGGDPKITMASWSSGVGLRALATIAVVGVFALFASKRHAAQSHV